MLKNRLWLGELATEVLEARYQGGQPRQTFQNGFIPQRLEFFTQFVVGFWSSSASFLARSRTAIRFTS
jgi:hypothetical protein